MAFVDYPPTALTTDWQDYAWNAQVVKSLDEVAGAADGIYPRPTNLYDGNLIQAGGLTSSSLTDTTKNWAIAPRDWDGSGTWLNRYVNWTSQVDDGREVAHYDIVLLKLFPITSAWEWPKMLRLPIRSQNMIDNGDTTFTSNQLNFDAFDTVNYPISYFTHYYIVRSDGCFTHDRVPEWPNDLTLEWAIATHATTTSISVSPLARHWAKDQWAGKYVYYTVGGTAVRSALITSNTGPTRTVPDAVLNSTTTLTSATAAFTAGDVGAAVAGDGIPAGATIASVTNATTVVLSAAATVTASGASVTITGDLVLHFAAVPTAPDVAVFGILNASGLYWRPSHQPQTPDITTNSTAVWPRRAWIRMGQGMSATYYSHHPDDNIGLAEQGFPDPALTIKDTRLIDPEDLVVDVVNPNSGYPASLDTDADVFTEIDTTLQDVDWCYTRPYHKTYRSWQSSLWSYAGFFIPYRSDFYSGTNRYHINGMSVPQLMWQGQVNAGKGTTGDIVMSGTSVAGINASLTLSETIEAGEMPIPVRVTIEKVRNWTYDSSLMVWTDNGPETHNKGYVMIADAPAYWDGTKITGLDGLTNEYQQQDVWITWGWTRQVPDRFRYFYAKECFIPDPVPPDDDPDAPPPPDEPQLPPTEKAPGNWYVRDKSTALIEYSEHGIVNDTIAPVVGTLARYEGDNWDGPTTDYSSKNVTTGMPWEVIYWDNFYEGKKSVIPNQTSNWDYVYGVITDVDDALQFGDSSQNWWGGVMIGDGNETTHNGTPTTLSTTTIADSTRTTSVFWDNSTEGRWVGHWVTIWQPGAIDSGGTAGPLHKASRPVTAYDPASKAMTVPAISGVTATYSYTDSSGVSHTGTTKYRLREPAYEKNRFAGAFVDVTRQSDDAVFTGTVTYSSDNRIRVGGWRNAAGASVTYTPSVKDAYRIRRVSTGTIWQWDGTQWVAPTGNDSRSGTAVPFPRETWTIPPTWRRKYGRIHNGDYVGIKFHTEIFKVRSALRMRKYTVCFTPAADPDDHTTINNRTWLEPNGLGWEGDPTIVEWSGGTCNPLAQSTSAATTINAERSCGYAQLDLSAGVTSRFLPETNRKLRVACQGRFLTYGQMDEADGDPGVIGTSSVGFDANGDPVAFRQWLQFGTGFGDSDALHHTSSKFGSLAEPDQAATPSPPDILVTYLGYYVRGAMAVVDYGPSMLYVGAPQI